MSITQQQKDAAKALQDAAAHDSNNAVRLIAGPGTGKSHAIMERVKWLLDKGVLRDKIFVVSFTRASSRDLRRRIDKYFLSNGIVNPDQISVSTLHSLALRALRTANQLNFPVDPQVLDDWEVENIYDQEFSKYSELGLTQNRYTPGRCKDIRKDYEAYCGTGIFSPPNLIPPTPLISIVERNEYKTFHMARTQVYSCVLPGEITRQCVEAIRAGIFNPVLLLGISQLIVDEYQDLNPIDIQFIDLLQQAGATLFIAGDDDQSIYSFRYASPEGLQTFLQRFPNGTSHVIQDCFRCTPNVLNAANDLINNFSSPQRLPKQIASLFSNSNPPEPGQVFRWEFRGGVQEARAIAKSCDELKNQGMPLQSIMILVSNTRKQLITIQDELTKAQVDFDSPRAESFIKTRFGHFMLGLLRIVCNRDDYLAYRIILGLHPNVGPRITDSIANLTTNNNLNYKDIFYNPLPDGVYKGITLRALNWARQICVSVTNWQPTDTINQRKVELENIALNIFGQNDLLLWQPQLNNLPNDMTIEELRDFLWAENSAQVSNILDSVYTRLGLNPPANGFIAPKVQVMTIHGSKGLEADVVFIPGLEKNILPGDRRIPFPGLVLEAARMLYVSITRAKAACILSFADYRRINGVNTRQTPSQFTVRLGGRFVPRQSGLTAQETIDIIQSCINL